MLSWVEHEKFYNLGPEVYKTYLLHILGNIGMASLIAK